MDFSGSVLEKVKYFILLITHKSMNYCLNLFSLQRIRIIFLKLVKRTLLSNILLTEISSMKRSFNEVLILNIVGDNTQKGFSC